MLSIVICFQSVNLALFDIWCQDGKGKAAKDGKGKGKKGHVCMSDQMTEQQLQSQGKMRDADGNKVGRGIGRNPETPNRKLEGINHAFFLGPRVRR